MIGAVISAVGGVAKAAIEGRKEKTIAKNKLAVADLENRAALMRDRESNNAAWEMAAMRESGRALKWASFSLFALPIIVTVIAPFFGANTIVGQMWENMRLVPEAWMKTYYLMTSSIWGIHALKDVGATPGALAGAFKNLRRRKNK